MDFQLPELGEGVYEAELTAWLVKVGDTVKRGQNLMEVMTDKATMEVPSPFAGTITALQAQPGQQIKVGEVVLAYDSAVPTSNNAPARISELQEAKAKPRAAAPPALAPLPPLPALPVKAAPSVRYLARKLGIDLAKVHGSGPGGRILIEDLSAQIKPANGPAQRQVAALPRPDFGTPGTRLKLQGVRRKIAEHMVQAKRLIPHYGYVDECDVTDLVRLREVLREPFARAGVKLTYLAFFIKAVAAALKEVPIVNSSLDDEAGEIVVHDKYHIGMAVATPNGLIVPVIHDADQKDLAQIARDIDRLGSEARVGKSRLEDLRGGTFTITSIGSIGGLFSTPVINHPEVGILGIGKIVKRPVFDAAGHVKPAEMMYLSFAFDHRVVDGAVGAMFGNAIIRQLQQPAVLLMAEKLLEK